jgi:hypothetical protein
MMTVGELRELREAAEYVLNGLMCGCIQMSVEASRGHRELADRFCFENGEVLDRADHEEARLNIFHLIGLIDRAIEAGRAVEQGERQPSPG